MCNDRKEKHLYVTNEVVDDEPDSLGIILGFGHVSDSPVEFKTFSGSWLTSWRL